LLCDFSTLILWCPNLGSEGEQIFYFNKFVTL